MATTTQPKRKRGRPRKTTTATTAAGATRGQGNGEAVMKRKPGRPRKGTTATTTTTTTMTTRRSTRQQAKKAAAATATVTQETTDQDAISALLGLMDGVEKEKEKEKRSSTESILMDSSSSEDNSSISTVEEERSTMKKAVVDLDDARIGDIGRVEDDDDDDDLTEVEDCYVPADDKDVAVMNELGEILGNDTEEQQRENTDKQMLQKIRDGVVSDSSKRAYACQNAQLVNYFYEQNLDTDHDGPQILTDLWIDLLEPFQNKTARVKEIKNLLKAPVTEAPPIQFNIFTPGLFILYLLSCSKKDGTRLSSAAYYGKRAALYHLYRSYEAQQDDEFQDTLSVLFKGLLRTVAEEVQAGHGKITTGKMPMPFPLYVELATWFLMEGTAVGIFAHLFLILSWNLACRSSNTKNIHLHHMGWVGDAMKVYFAHMKNDQSGERPRDPRHLYCNPYNFVVCPVLSVIMYFLTNTPTANDSHLFPGSDQYNRFNKFLKAKLEAKRDHISMMYGLTPEDIGAHSLRKGASTYMTSGVVGGPSFQAVNIRCGWKMPGVTDTYARYEAAGDMYTGRVLCGLPLTSFRFGILPPVFDITYIEGGIKTVEDLVMTLFPGLIPELRPVVTHGLAILAYQEDRLRDKLDRDHCLFDSAVWIHPVFHHIKRKWRLQLGVGDDDMELETRNAHVRKATGIPNHTVMLVSQRNLMLQQRKMMKSNEELPDKVIDGLSDALENLTLHTQCNNNMDKVVEEVKNMTEVMTAKLDEIQRGGTSDRVDGEDLSIAPLPVVEDDTSTLDEGALQTIDSKGNKSTVYMHKGRFIKIPPSFVFPKKCSLQDIFVRFHTKDTVRGIPALKCLDNQDVKHLVRGSQVLSDCRYLMWVFEALAREKGMTTVGLNSYEDAVEKYSQLHRPIILLETKNKERREQFKWQTWVRKCRIAKMNKVEIRKWS